MRNLICCALTCLSLLRLAGGDCLHDCSVRAHDPLCGEDRKVYPNLCPTNCIDIGVDYTWEKCYPCSFLCNQEEFDPVCGSDGILYSSRCFLLLKSCKTNGEVFEVSRVHCCFTRECKESVRCGEICERLLELQTCFSRCKTVDNSHQPICGTDGQIYSHQCYLGCKNQTASLQSRICYKCDRFCPYIYEPVCGSNKVIYANKCLLTNAICRSGGKIKEVLMKKCCRKKPNCPN